MKKLINFPVILLLAISASGQVNFENLSYDAALQRSKQTGKLIFLQFESTGCNQCNEVADKAFDDHSLGEQIEQTFICIKISTDHPDRAVVGSRYNKKDGFGTLFISSDGTLLHQYPGSTTLPSTYQDHIDKALTKAGEGLQVSQLEKEYHSGNKSPGLMEILMDVKKTLNLQTDDLLEEYVNLLPEDSFSSIRTLQFIASMAPVLGSKADEKLHKNNSLFQQCWYAIDLPKRLAINNRITSKSLKKAIREKNEIYATRVAAFRRSTYNNNHAAGQKAFELKMIEFYKETFDTVNYVRRAFRYYDAYYMIISIDSIKKMDSLNRLALLAKQTPVPTQNGSIRKTIKYSPLTQNYNRELNNAAATLGGMSNDPQSLQKAISWSRRANAFFESYISMNTLAQLLHRSGNFTEARAWQEKAIALKKERGFDTRTLEQELAAMTNGD